MTEEWAEHLYGEGNSPAFLTWTSRLAVTQAWAGVDEDLKGLKKPFNVLRQPLKTGDLELVGNERPLI